nr:putative ribonuclease H-like domain-containing protein [Tanacetum cinerariifolium]
ASNTEPLVRPKSVSSVDQPLFRLYMDHFGPTFVKSLSKKSYCLVITDDYSRFSWVFFLATKDETATVLKTFIIGLENLLSLKVKIIRCDNGTEFKNADLNQFCRLKGIRREFSVPRTPQQNGRQSQGYAGIAGKNQASGARVVNTVGNAWVNQLWVIRCYNCNSKGHIAKQCTAKKRVKDSKWFKDKMLLAQAQEAGVANHVDAYDSDCDDEAIANAIFMVNLSPVGSSNDDTVPPHYDSNTLSEVPHYDTYHDDDMLNSVVQET